MLHRRAKQMTPDNTDDRTYIHNLLDISDNRAKEIANEVSNT
jgi:hypothetical protein